MSFDPGLIEDSRLLAGNQFSLTLSTVLFVDQVFQEHKEGYLHLLTKMHSGKMCKNFGESEKKTKRKVSEEKRSQRRGRETKDADVVTVFLH